MRRGGSGGLMRPRVVTVRKSKVVLGGGGGNRISRIRHLRMCRKIEGGNGEARLMKLHYFTSADEGRLFTVTTDCLRKRCSLSGAAILSGKSKKSKCRFRSFRRVMRNYLSRRRFHSYCRMRRGVQAQLDFYGERLMSHVVQRLRRASSVVGQVPM